MPDVCFSIALLVGLCGFIVYANINYYGVRQRLSPEQRRAFDAEDEHDRLDNPAP